MLKTKFFRVAREGATTDNRKITAEQIDQMAANYKPDTYGARIWLEHYRGLFPDSIFKALGDVVSLKADTDDEGKRVLLAELNPTSELIEMNSNRQKVFTSIEMDPSFGDTGEAYMYGLAVTDSPASMGTEMLKFSRGNQEFAEKFAKELGDHVYSDPFETAMEMAVDEPDKPNLFSRVKDLISKKNQSDDAQFADVNESVLAIAESQQGLTAELEKFSAGQTLSVATISELGKQFSALSTELKTLKGNLEQNPDSNYRERPPADGGDGLQLADC